MCELGPKNGMFCRTVLGKTGEMMQFIWKVLCGFSCAAIATALVLRPPLSSQDYAAWVQAFGSIGAIIGSFVIMGRQATHDKQLAADAEKRAILNKVDVAQQLMEDASEQIVFMIHNVASAAQEEEADEVVRKIRVYGLWKGAMEAFDDIQKSLNQIPLMELGSSEFVRPVRRMAQFAAAFRMFDGEKRQELLEPAFAILAENCANDVIRTKKEFDQARERLLGGNEAANTSRSV